MRDGLEEQPIPESARCPECGGELTDASHDLKEFGYLHDDVDAQCVECGRMQRFGIPIGEPEPEEYDDLVCGSCGDLAIVKQFKVNHETDEAFIHVKCESCYIPWTVTRQRQNHLWTLNDPRVTGA